MVNWSTICSLDLHVQIFTFTFFTFPSVSIDSIKIEQVPTNLEECREFVMQANGGHPESGFNDPRSLQIYNDCGEMLRAGIVGQQMQQHPPPLHSEFPTKGLDP